MPLDPWIERQGFDQQSASQTALCMELARMRNEVSEALEALSYIVDNLGVLQLLEAHLEKNNEGTLLRCLHHVGEHLQWALNP